MTAALISSAVMPVKTRGFDMSNDLRTQTSKADALILPAGNQDNLPVEGFEAGDSSRRA